MKGVGQLLPDLFNLIFIPENVPKHKKDFHLNFKLDFTKLIYFFFKRKSAILKHVFFCLLLKLNTNVNL